jgi:hypothetical protein
MENDDFIPALDWDRDVASIRRERLERRAQLNQLKEIIHLESLNDSPGTASPTHVPTAPIAVPLPPSFFC